MTRAQYFLNLISKYCIAFLHVFKQYFEKKGLAKIWVQKYLMIMLDNLKSNCLEKNIFFIIIITYYIYKIQKKIISTMSWSDMF